MYNRPSNDPAQSARPRRNRRHVKSGIAGIIAVGVLLVGAIPASANSGTSRVNFVGTGANAVVYRPPPAPGTPSRSPARTFIVNFGVSTDVPFPEDYDGDGLADAAVRRPSTNQWYIRSSQTGAVSVFAFGLSTDVAFPARWVGGDARADVAVYRPSTGQWWFRDTATGAVSVTTFGTSTDTIEPGDYDGDGITDVAVQRTTGAELVAQLGQRLGHVVNFGLGTDFNAQGDYDGDGTTDWAKVRTQSGQRVWYLMQSTNGFAVKSWGTSTDTIAPADYDGDGKIDLAIFRAGSGQWWIQKSSNGATTILNWGQIGDLAVVNDYIT